MRYYRTYKDGTSEIHLEGIGDAYALCGLDIAGDSAIHDKPPELLAAEPHRVTCLHCHQIIQLVKGYIKQHSH